MQRDFIEPGGFGETLGNDVTRLQAIVPACARVLAAWRAAGGWVVHTREAHAPDLSDCPPAKRERGAPRLRIGDVGPRGRILVAGEPGNQIVAALAPTDAELVIDKPGKGAFYATPLQTELMRRGITHLVFMGVTTEVCVQSSMREANDRGFDALLLEDCTESYFPAFKQSAIAMMVAQGGIVGWATTSEVLLAALPASQASVA
jgi:nicotinamidase-related amidase